MSTYLYLECLNHDPVLTSWGEVGQHLSDLPRIRDEIAKRDLFVANANADLGIDYGSHFANNAAHFLAAHPRCDIGIRDEYGDKHPIRAKPEMIPPRGPYTPEQLTEIQKRFDASEMCNHCCHRVSKPEIDAGMHKHPAVMD